MMNTDTPACVSALGAYCDNLREAVRMSRDAGGAPMVVGLPMASRLDAVWFLEWLADGDGLQHESGRAHPNPAQYNVHAWRKGMPARAYSWRVCVRPTVEPVKVVAP